MQPNFHDFGTVRIYEVGDALEAHFSKNDAKTRTAIKRFNGTYDSARRTWRIENKTVAKERIISAIRDSILEGVPAGWRKNLHKLEKMGCVTRAYGLVFGAGGIRAKVPSGHKHEYTLRNKIPEAEAIGREWSIPASSFNNPVVRQLIGDIVAGDREIFSRSVDYMEGYAIYGTLAIDETDPLLMHVAEGNVVFATPEFVRRVDDKIEAEPLFCYPLAITKALGDVGEIAVTCKFLTGKEGYAAAEHFSRRPQTPLIDVNHLDGRWRRRRV